jgi:hypothetical protein
MALRDRMVNAIFNNLVLILTFEVRRFPFDVSYVFLFWKYRNDKRLQENAYRQTFNKRPLAILPS